MRPQERTISAAPFVMRRCSFQLSLRQIPQGPLFFDFKDEAHYHSGSGSRHFGHSLADEFANGARDSPPGGPEAGGRDSSFLDKLLH